ncbi:YdhR family protein [Methylocella silvestris]|uniref:Mono-oxygenase ydhR n=1 Tax=Methylocella silvestris TaxID=199596 RepID=A0A2J7THE6_METSI|nr:YdhR family protein [Methylocella silvestris]PNG26194.1 hypothetical protein CR492_10155 [Methylocella silvestris]
MSLSKVFLYAEIQVSIPFGAIDWRPIDVEMKKNPGLKSKTWLAGLNTNTIGGFYEFDSVANADAYARGYLAEAARRLGGQLSVKLFDGEVTAAASRAIHSPFYASEGASPAVAEAQERATAVDA